MSALQENLLNAVSILANSAVNQSNATITIECKIIEAVDAAIGLYTVEYMSNQFNAYSNPSVSYNINDIVYVLIPDGDLTKTKTIIGSVTPSASIYATEENSDNYVTISNNLFNSINDVELCTYNSDRFNLTLDADNFNIVFKNYLENYNNFLFTAKIKTDIPLEQQQGGNYGIILNLPFNKIAEDGSSVSQIWKPISIDVNTIQGNPYRLNEYSLQNIYFEIEEGSEYDTSRTPYITAFVQDFAQDASIVQTDIWIKDIALKTVEVLTEEDKQGYYLSLIASEGNYFLNNKYDATKTLTPILKINGKSKNLNGYECYWFVEDSSIDTTSEGYSSIGGLGWKCLNKKTNVYYNEDGRLTYQYVTNIYNIKVNQTDILSTLRFKCTLVKDNITVSGILCLKNLNSEIEVALVSASGLTNFVKDIGYVNLIARVYYPGVSDNPSSTTIIETAWQRFDKVGNYLDNNFFEYVRKNDPVEITSITGITRTWLETEIRFPCSMIEQFNIINCSFFSIDTLNAELNRYNLGTSSLLVSATEEFTYKIAIQNGDVLYKYDSDGDSPLVAEYDGPISSRINEIQPLTFKIYKANGTELNEIEYLYCDTEWAIPKNSMIKLKTTSTSDDDDYWYVSGQGQININYTIINSFNTKKSDNTIILTVKLKDNILTEAVNIKFLKDGGSGTNGSKYAGVVTYNGYAYGEKDNNRKTWKLQCINVVDNWGLLDCATGEFIPWPMFNPQLDVSVYCDGELLNSSEYTVEWNMFDPTNTDPDFIIVNGNINYRDTAYNENSVSIVEAKITVGNPGVTNGQEVIYAYYPIETTYLPFRTYADGLLPTIEGGFNEVVYAADGTNPKYDNSSPFNYTDNLDKIDATSYYIYNWTCSDNIKIQDIDSGICSAKPITKFDNGETLNYIKVKTTITAEGKSEVDDELAALNIKISNLQDEISYYQQLLQHLIDFCEIFDYNSYINRLNNCKELLGYRSFLVIYVEQLLSALEDINEYCIEKNILPADFNYPDIYNNIKNLLTILNNNLYGFGYYTSFVDLNRLTNAVININDIDNFKNKYGINVYDVLNSLLISYNDILQKKYWVTYDKLCLISSGVYVYQSQFDDFKRIEVSLLDIKDDSNLLWLQTSHYGFGPEQEFINLKNQISIIINKLFDTNSYCYNYDAININILKELQKIVVKYQDNYYSSYYNNKIAFLNEELKTEKIKLSDFNKILLDKVEGTIIHIKPIIMLFNRYEMSNLNGWDGSKLYIDELNEEYLLAPQIGAGLKSEGTFTGLVMGIKQFNSTTNQHIGLFGYNKGIQSYFLNAEDGSAIMGKSGTGQIIIDPSQDKALIYSSNYFINYNNDGKPQSYGRSNWAGEGMLIDLSTPEIRFGSGKFLVNSDGELTAKGGGSIAGWKIGDTQLYSDVAISDGRITLDSEDTGKIYSYSHNTLSSISQGFYLSKEGLSIGNSIRISSENGGGIQVGNLSGSRYWNINGNSSNSYIAYGTTTLNSGTNSVYVGTDGISLGSNKFYVTNSGSLTSKSGSIGGWSIGSSSLTGGSTTLNSDGTITCNKLIANTYGSIGGWNINGNSLTSGSITLNASNGSITAGGGVTLSSGGLTGANFTLNGAGLTFTNGGASISAGGVNLTESMTKVGGTAINTYINNLIVNNATIKGLLSYQGISTGWHHHTVATVSGTTWVDGTATVDGKVGTCRVQIPNIESISIYYLGTS